MKKYLEYFYEKSVFILLNLAMLGYYAR